MNKIIDLSSTVFDPAFLAPAVDAKVPFLTDKGKPLSLPDFGTILIGSDSWDERIWAFVDEICVLDSAPLFSCPEEWRMPQVIRALGIFKSANQAAKNGWNFDIPEGFSQHQIRLNKVKGLITIFKDNRLLHQNGFWKKIVGQFWDGDTLLCEREDWRGWEGYTDWVNAKSKKDPHFNTSLVVTKL